MAGTAAGQIADVLRSVVGAEHVVVDDGERLDYFSHDMSFEPVERAEAVVAPGSVEELAAVVRAAHADGFAVAARGGGTSYTKAFTPVTGRTMIVDTRRLNRIDEINARDGYVTVECGVTWDQLYAALREEGMRTPHFGPNSGRYATIGGALAQNTTFWGDARHGTLADCALSVEVVTGDGRLVKTGSAARAGSPPFFRYLGPDLTGLFVGDAGALGIKARATLRTIPFPEHTLYHSVAVPDLAGVVECMEATQRLGLAGEIYNFDPFYAESLDRAGIDVLRDHPWSVHFTVDGASADIARSGMAKLQDVAAGFGQAIDPTVAEMFRADPYGWVQAVITGPEGQIWLPIHAFLPWSRARSAVDGIARFQADNRAVLDEHGIRMSFLTLCSHNAWLFEPSFYWFDELGPLRLERVSPEAASQWARIPPDLEARAAVLALRRELATQLADLGAVNLQLGKYYSYAPVLEPAALELVRAVKETVDPGNRVNPGALGL